MMNAMDHRNDPVSKMLLPRVKSFVNDTGLQNKYGNKFQRLNCILVSDKALNISSGRTDLQNRYKCFRKHPRKGKHVMQSVFLLTTLFLTVVGGSQHHPHVGKLPSSGEFQQEMLGRVATVDLSERHAQARDSDLQQERLDHNQLGDSAAGDKAAASGTKRE